MKKNLLITFACVLVFFISSPAHSAEGLYVSGNLGLTLASDSDINIPGLPTITAEFDPGWALGGAVGYDFNQFRVEGEISYQKNDFDKLSAMGYSFDATGEMTGFSLLINGYYDFVNNSQFTPYITAGIGYAKIEINDFSISGLPDAVDDDDTVFAYQIGAGIAFVVNNNVTIDFKYRYFATENPKFDTAEAEVASHNIYIGARYYF